MKALTERQLEVIRFIQRYQDENSCPPTVREMAEHFSISIKSVQDRLSALRKKGYIAENSDKRSRAIKVLVGDNTGTNIRKIQEIPVFGAVAAGRPIFCEENYEDTICLPLSMLSPGSQYFAVYVRGSSMINAGIFDGDLAVIKQCSVASDGDIVVALIDDSVTLKRFYKEAARIRLQPENPEFKPIYSQNVRILGVLSNLIRNY